jgi:hypothetical protein
MPTRRHLNPIIDAAIERRLNKLRQLPARMEAERLIARKFAEAGRPLRPDVGFEERVGNKPFSSNADEPERQPWSQDFRKAFVVGAAIAAAVSTTVRFIFA